MDHVEKTLKDIVIIYHADCRDGFGSAFAAWKKFGDQASYLPRKTQTNVPEGLTDKEIYILDYCYNQDILQKLVETNKSVVVIDHHQMMQKTIESFEGNVFDNDHSGAVLSWKYFHPNVPVPSLLEYVEDHDLWRFALPENREYNTALGLYPMTFESWDIIINKLQNPKEKANFLAKGVLIAKFEDKLVEELLEYKERVRFEGHEVWALNATRTYRSILGNRLAGMNLQEEKTPIGIVYYRYGGTVHVSLRSHGDIDVAEIARKYGGGGHKNAASFKVKNFSNLPFVPVEQA